MVTTHPNQQSDRGWICTEPSVLLCYSKRMVGIVHWSMSFRADVSVRQQSAEVSEPRADHRPTRGGQIGLRQRRIEFNDGTDAASNHSDQIQTRVRPTDCRYESVQPSGERFQYGRWCGRSDGIRKDRDDFVISHRCAAGNDTREPGNLDVRAFGQALEPGVKDPCTGDPAPLRLPAELDLPGIRAFLCTKRRLEPRE